MGFAAKARGQIRDGADGAVIDAPWKSDATDRGKSLGDAHAHQQIVATLLPSGTEGNHFPLHGQGHARGAGRRVVDAHRVVEKNHDAVAGETLQRAFVLQDQPAHGRMVFTEDAHHLLGIGGFGKGGEAAQVQKNDGNLAPVAFQRIIGATGDDQIGQLRRKEAFQATDLLQLFHPFGDARLKRLVPIRQFGLLPHHLVVQMLDAQQRPDAGQQLGLIHRLGQKIVGAGVQSLGAFLGRIQRRHQHHRQHAVRRVGPNRLTDFVTAHAGHHHVQQNQIRRLRLQLVQPFLTGGRRHGLVALGAKQVGQQLDVHRHIVNHQNLRSHELFLPEAR